MDQVRETFARAGLSRPQTGRWLAGVCTGLAARLGVDPWIPRLAFVLLTVMGGSSLLVYAVLWFCMPPQGWIAPPRTP